MKRILLMVLVITAQIFAQELFRVQPEEVLVSPANEGVQFRNPKWSPDGSRIALTGNNYRGIWIYELSTRQLELLTDEGAAGFGFSWSADGNYILTDVAKYENGRRLDAVKMFNIAARSEKTLIDYRTNLRGTPRWTSGDSRVYLFDGRKIQYLDTGFRQNTLGKNTAWQSIVYSKGDKIILEDTGTGLKTQFRPFDGEQYLNLHLSPDGKKVVFEVYGGNCHVLNLETSEVFDLGTGYRPQWSPDGQFVVYMMTQDDGHNYTASDIFVSDFNGSAKQNITANSARIAMDPDWSPDGNRIVYSAYREGDIISIGLEK